MCSENNWHDENNLNNYGYKEKEEKTETVYSCAGPRIVSEEDFSRKGEDLFSQVVMKFKKLKKRLGSWNKRCGLFKRRGC